jgi:uncharacterized membrane protein
VPLVGLRRNAPALAGGLILLLIVAVVVPDLTPASIGGALPPADPSVTRALVLLLAVFAVAVTVVGGWRGVRSLIALALTLAVIVKIVVPLVLAGWEPVGVTIAAATGVTITTLLLTEGMRMQTIAASAGTFLSLAIVAGLALAFDALAHFTSFGGAGDAVTLQAAGLPALDVGKLILAAIVVGAVGILGDVTFTQATTVTQVHEAEPRLRRRALAARGVTAGRSHMTASINALVLAFVGASLPLIVLFAAGRQNPLTTASTEAVAVEVVRAIVASIGIVAAVPLTAIVAATLIERRVPFVRRRGPVRHAPGWD